MLKNYFLTAWRIMSRQKAYSAINILGLSLGMAASILIVIYIVDELSYDKFHKDGDRIYRINTKGSMNGNDFNMGFTPAPMSQALREEVPAVENATRIGIFRTMPMQYGEKTLTEPLMAVADSNFFDFFTYLLVEGNPKTVLQGKNKVILTESTASRYFGNENPMGKILLRGSEKIATEVVGIMADPPRNSHLDFGMVLSAQSWPYMEDTHWTGNNIYTYFKLNPGASAADVEQALDGFIAKYIGPELEQVLGISLATLKEQGSGLGYYLMPLHRIHLYSENQDFVRPGGDIKYLYVFGAVAFFIIIIACINFMNLSTARSANRAKEVGVRKSIGAEKSRLVFQFLSESVMYSLLSVFVAAFLIVLALGPFNSLSGKNLDFGIFTSPMLVVGLLVFAVLVGVLAGSYPSFYLTSFSPAAVLKGKIRSGAKRSLFRNGLVVFQFFISISLIISSMVVYRQLRYMQEKDLGFDKENMINLLHTASLGQNGATFKQELLAQSGILSASYVNDLPPDIPWNTLFRTTNNNQDFLCNLFFVDHDIAETMGLEIVKGRFFSKDYKTDTAAVVLNETAFKLMGFTEIDGTQKISSFWEGGVGSSEKTLIGVVKDFNFETLRNQVKPLVFTLGGEPNGELAIKLAGGDIPQTLQTMEKIWKKHANGASFEYSFVDANFNSLFQAEQKMGNIILIFTVLAIGIACLGLFGLAAYTTEQRSKEISIRKAMGATVAHLVTILSKDFTVLVLLAFVISGPLTYYLMSKYWLTNFAYRIEIDLLLIMLAGLISIVIAWLTVSYQSFKTAASNPVDYLRNE
jgi:putative ABC transport system permease protein